MMSINTEISAEMKEVWKLVSLADHHLWQAHGKCYSEGRKEELDRIDGALSWTDAFLSNFEDQHDLVHADPIPEYRGDDGFRL